MNDYDEKLNNIILDNKTPSGLEGILSGSKVGMPTLGDEMSAQKPESILSQMKRDQLLAKDEKPGESKILNMLDDIDNEFDELDKLMKDIDTIKIQNQESNNENAEERISNSSFEHEI